MVRGQWRGPPRGHIRGPPYGHDDIRGPPPGHTHHHGGEPPWRRGLPPDRYYGPPPVKVRQYLISLSCESKMSICRGLEEKWICSVSPRDLAH